jgi:hypothetical protein
VRESRVPAGSTAAGHRPGFVPTLPELVAVLLAVALPIGLGRHWLSLDGDPARHIRVGETILRSGLFYRDPFSFTKAGAPFVPYEWLSEVIDGLSVRAAGLPGLIVLTGAILAVTYALVTRTLVRRGVAPIVAIPTLLLAMAIGSEHWHARPHLWTLLGAAALMALIDRGADPHQNGSLRAAWRAAWPMIPLFAIWANLHGGFLYGLFVLAAVVVGDRVEMLYATGPDVMAWRGALVRHGAMLATAAFAALLTPSGPRLYVHTLGYLGDTYLVNNTQEYMSPDFHVARFALIAIVAATSTLAILPRRASFPTLAVVAMNLAFSLMSGRNIPLFGVVALPLVAQALQRALETWVPGWSRQRLGRPVRGVNPSRLAPGWPVAAIIAMFILARTTSGTVQSADQFAAGATLFPTTFNPAVFPVRAVEAARAAGLAGRIFHEFTWGGYILYAWPEQRVFIDGQTDFYGDSITRQYTSILGLEPGWRRKLDAWRIDLALIETVSPLADALAHEEGWHPVYCDSTAVLFQRGDARRPVLGPSASLSASCQPLVISPLAAAVRRDSMTDGR